MKHLISLLLCLLMIFALAACGDASKTENHGEEAVNEVVVTVADPQTAIDMIYEGFERSKGLKNATDKEVTDVMGFDLETIEEYHIRYMETDYGASDVYIIKPVKGQEETVRQALKDWQEVRIRSFIGYDIYNSTSISEDALIFQRGEYIIMLMLEDNDAARAIVEQYIPEELNLD